MVAFSILINKSNELVGELEHAALEVMDSIKLRYYSSEENTREDEEQKADVVTLRKVA